MKNSHIEWTDNTFNPWIGCTKVSPGCANCYAEARDQRFAEGKHWGKGAPRQRTSAANWKQPLKWNREAAGEGKETLECPSCEARWKDCECGFAQRRPRVFCASLADWLDDEVPIEWLADLLKLIHDTPNLDWLLLTKRPQNWYGRVLAALDHIEGNIQGADGRDIDPLTDVGEWLNMWLGKNQAPTNIWIGTTVEDQLRADERIPLLLNIPAKGRFLSCEPLLEAVDFLNAQCGYDKNGYRLPLKTNTRFADWVICGGESGTRARPMHPDWARSLRDQCQAAGVAFFMKQWGEWSPAGGRAHFREAIPHKTQHVASGITGEPPAFMVRDGKKAAGRELDGQQWNEFPQPQVIA